MRVSDSKRYDVVAKRVDDAKLRNERALLQVSTQKRINNVEDDPLGLSSTINLTNDIANKKQFQRNIEYGLGFLENTEAAVSTLSDKLIRAKELAIGMANDTYAQSSRDAVAKEVSEIMKEILSLGNTTFNNRYVFSGFRSRTPAFGGGGDYLGDDGQLFIPIGKGDFRQINVTGRELFEANPDERAEGHFNLMDNMEILFEGLSSNDKALIHTAINELDYQLDKVTSIQATIGALHSGLQNTSQRLELQEEQSTKIRSQIEDVDMYKATSDFKKSETVLQSTLLASNKLLQPSLLNFMQ